MFSENTLLYNHLRYNVIPAIKEDVIDKAVETCTEVIDACMEEDYDREITFPSGVVLTAEEIADDLKLHDFVTMRQQEAETEQVEAG
jgi:phosphoribosyl-ATP pyrophosphohydrolase